MPSGWRLAELHVADFVAGAQRARGLTVVIDVFRAFSVAAHAFARGANEVITGALVNAGAIVRYICSRAPAIVTLVRMGHEAAERCDEDDLCAQLLQQRLAGERPSVAEVPERLRSAASAQKFFDPACDWAPQRDFELCTQVDAFDFVLQLERGDVPARLKRVEVP